MMADFKQAIEWMKKGKEVTRPNKVYTYRLHMGFYKKSLGNDCIYCAIGQDKNVVNQLSASDFEATDWEIYGEDNWKLTDLNNWHNAGGYHEMAIKILIEKIKKDIDYYAQKEIRDKALCCAYRFNDIKEIIDKRVGDLDGKNN